MQAHKSLFEKVLISGELTDVALLPIYFQISTTVK